MKKACVPQLTPEQAFSVLWVLQEVTRVIEDKWECCDECGDLFDSYGEGHYDEEKGKHFCDDCGN